MNLRHDISLGLLLGLVVFSAPVLAASRALTPDESLDQDLSGPRVAWLGEIAAVLLEVDDTCFVLDRVQETYEGYVQRATRFLACAPGSFDGEEFAPGNVLQVEGNLGPAMARRVGGQEITAHLVAAPRLTPQPDFVAQPYPPPYYGYPYYDPWYPHVGVWWGFHHHRRR